MSIASIFGEEWDDYMGTSVLMDFISTLAIAITQSKESSRVAVEVFPHDRLHLPSFEQDDIETDSAGVEF